MASMRDVAHEAGVSLSTVSVVLSKSDKNVSEEKKEQVLKAAERVGYKVKKRKQSKIIAVLLPNITSAFFSNLLSGIEAGATKSGYTLLFGHTGFDFEKELNFMQTVRKYDLQGVIIDSSCPADREAEYYGELQEMFVERNIPVVILERNMNKSGFSTVYSDHIQNAYKATRHLLDMGHSKIVYLSGPLDSIIGLERLSGYQDALEEAGISFSKHLVCTGDYSPNSGYMAMKEMLAQNNSFTAVFAANDQMAIGAMKAIKSVGKRIPEDIAVVGIDNISLASMINPGLTTISVPTYQMGLKASRHIINGQSGNKNENLEGNLIVRKSTNKYADSEWDLFGW